MALDGAKYDSIHDIGDDDPTLVFVPEDRFLKPSTVTLDDTHKPQTTSPLPTSNDGSAFRPRTILPPPLGEQRPSPLRAYAPVKKPEVQEPSVPPKTLYSFQGGETQPKKLSQFARAALVASLSGIVTFGALEWMNRDGSLDPIADSVSLEVHKLLNTLGLEKDTPRSKGE